MGAAPLAPQPRSLLPIAWPLVLGFLSYPVLWALGLAPFAWPLAAAPMALHLARRRDLVAPRGFGVWLLLLLWMCVSATQLPTTGAAAGFAYRFAQYLAATLVLVYAYNLPASYTLERGRALLRYTFAAVTIGGIVALAAPETVLASLTLQVLPGGISNDEFVQVLFTPSVAQVQTFLGFELPRPSAPFEYTNTWGATYALLFPWILADVLEPGPSRRRRGALALLLVSLVPAVVSVNRGMWVSIGASLVVLLVSNHDPRVRRAVRAALVVIPLLVLVAAVSPVGELVQDRFSTPHSNNARLDVATGTTDAVSESPWLGFGGPRAYEGPGIRPALGTQGQLWLVTFSHGIPALLAYLAFFVLMWRLTRTSPQRTWARMMLVAMAVHLPFYNHIGVPLVVIMFATALTLRAAGARRPVPARTSGAMDWSTHP